MGSAEYAAQLQLLLSQLLEPHKPDAAIDFTRCVYYQCYPEIAQRLCLPVSVESVAPFEQFGPGTIDVNEIRPWFNCAGVPIAPKFVRHGDV